MRSFIIISAFGVALAGGGCGKSGLDGKLDELAKIRDEVCACKDKACADAAHDKYIAWKKGNSKEDKPDGDQMKKFAALRTELNDCRRKLSDTTPPAAPGGAAAPAPASPPAPGAAAP